MSAPIMPSIPVSRESGIRMLLNLTAQMLAAPPLLEVPLGDFPLWLKHIGCLDGVVLKLQHDGRVCVSASERVDGLGYMTVQTTVDVVRGIELPSAESPGLTRLPLEQLGRLEVFEAVAS